MQPQLFFIVGAQKSGTTWLQRLLNSCPGIGCFGESHFIDRFLLPCAQLVGSYNEMMKLVADRVYEGNGYYGGIDNAEYMLLMRTWFLRMIQRTAGEQYNTLLAVGDKTPAHSFHMNIIGSLFPGCRFIHMMRDGRDVVCSAYGHRKRILTKLGQQDHLKEIQVEAPDLFLKWYHFTDAVLTYEKTGLPVHTVRYEDLLINPHSELLSVLHYLLPAQHWNAFDLAKVVATNSFSAFSGGRPSGVNSSQSFLRRGLAGGWRRDLSQRNVDAWNPEGLALLNQLGYN